MIEPTDLERPYTLFSYVTLSECYLQFEVWFPLNPFFVDVLWYFGLTIFKITPNVWAHMIELFNYLQNKE